MSALQPSTVDERVPPQRAEPPGLPGPDTPPPAAGGAPRQGRLRALDGLRLVAALSVLLFHYLARGGNANHAWGRPSRTVIPALDPIADYAWLGVELFFIISGFVICMSCWGRSLGQFFRSRVTRLYPAYWAAIVLTVIAESLVPTVVKQRMSLHDILLNLTMLHEPLGSDSVDGVFWTLWVELRFYLLFALVVWKGVTYRRAVLFCCLWTASSVVAVAADDRLLKTLLVPQYSAYFIGGIGLYLVHRFGSNVLSWGIVGISWMIAQRAVIDETERFSKMIHAPLAGSVAAAAVTVFFVVMAGVALGWFSRLNWRWLTTAGALTYPLYLMHEHIGHLVIHALRDRMPPPAVIAVSTGCMLLLAWLVHRLFERPLARLLRRLLDKPVPLHL